METMKNNLPESEEKNKMPDYEAEIIQIIRSNATPRKMLSRLEDYHSNDIAQILSVLAPQERKKIYRICHPEMLADIFEYLEEEEAGIYLNEMDVQKSAGVISCLETNTAVDILRQTEREKRELLIAMLNPDVKEEIRLTASFDEDEIGSYITANFIVIHENITIKQAMSELIRQAEENDNISTIFVVDENDEFFGAIDLKDLITARSTKTLENLIITSFPYLYGNELIDDCIERLKEYSEDSIPVLDNHNQLLGVITAKSVVEVVDDELGEDYARLAGLTAEEDLQEPLMESMKKRLPWLLVLLGLGMLVSTVVSSFEKVVAQLPLIMAFQSLILDMAGNVGTQSLALNKKFSLP